jgi:uncharacterized protein DUF397
VAGDLPRPALSFTNLNRRHESIELAIELVTNLPNHAFWDNNETEVMITGRREHVSQHRSAGGWRKSSQCETNTCLEISPSNGLLLLRNSTRPGITVSCTAVEWESFRDALIRGDFDDLEIETAP